MAHRISLNSQKLSLKEKPGLVQRNKPPFKESFNPQAQRDQSSLDVDTRVFGPFINGIGRLEIPTLLTKDPDQYMMYADGLCDARWPTGVYAALKLTGVTDTATERFWKALDWQGNLQGFWTNIDATMDLVVFAFDSGTPDWDATGATVIRASSASNLTFLDAIQWKNGVVVSYALADDIRTEYSVAADLSAWFTTGGGGGVEIGGSQTNGYLASDASDNDEIDGVKFAALGTGELVAAVRNGDAGTIEFWTTSSTLSAANDQITWATESISIASAGGPTGIAVIPGPDNLDHIILGTREGPWVIGSLAGTWAATKMNSPLSASPDNSRNMVNHNGEAWMAQGVSVNDTFQVYRVFYSGARWVHEPVPGSPHLRDGLPTDMLGTVTTMASSGGFCYIGVGGGAASRNATVLCHNGSEGFPGGWHPLAQIATANRKIHTMAASAEDDGTVRLHFDEKVGANDSEPYILEDINSHPNTALNIAREATSTINLPVFDGGMPNTPAIWMQVRGKINDLDDDNNGERVEAQYGLDGEDSNTNSDLGNGLAADATHVQNEFYSNAKVLEWIKDAATPFTVPKGVSSVGMGLKLLLKSITPATPRIQAIEVDYLKIPGIINEFEFDVDLDASVEETPGLKAGAIVTNLRTALANQVLVEFTDNNEDTIYVHVDRLEEHVNREATGNVGTINSTNPAEIITGGTVKVAVSQIIT